MSPKKNCRICKKYDRQSDFVNIFELNVTNSTNEHTISLFEAMQQLTGIQINYGDQVSNKLCAVCQKRIKFAYSVREQIIEAVETKPKRVIEVYKIITSNDDENEELKYISSKPVPIELTSNDNDLDDASNLSAENTEDIKYIITDIKIPPQESELPIGSFEIEPVDVVDNTDQQIDAVSFLLDKTELFESKKKIAEPEKRTHVCKVCDKTFVRKSNLVDHLRLHANVRLYKCEFCEKSFVQAGNYRSHLRIHTKERPFKCSMCPKTYNQSSALKVHIRTHTNERRYICDVCEKAFTNSSDLNKHKRVHDPSQKIKCDFCEKTFAQKVNLKNHIYRHHEHTHKGIKAKNRKK